MTGWTCLVTAGISLFIATYSYFDKSVQLSGPLCFRQCFEKETKKLNFDPMPFKFKDDIQHRRCQYVQHVWNIPSNILQHFWGGLESFQLCCLRFPDGFGESNSRCSKVRFSQGEYCKPRWLTHLSYSLMIFHEPMIDVHMMKYTRSKLKERLQHCLGPCRKRISYQSLWEQ